MSSDDIGNRGEAIFRLLMTDFHIINGVAKPLFSMAFLGEKWPTVDYLVELNGATKAVVPLFLVQVKTTRQGYTSPGNRLQVQVKAKDARRLARYPVPAYLVGIDEVTETGYIVSANGETAASLPHLCTDFRINATNRQNLWDEVHAFWTSPHQPKLTSVFVNSDWK